MKKILKNYWRRGLPLQNFGGFAPLLINLRGLSLQQTDNVTYLGVNINDNLSWKPHVRDLCKKLGKKLGVLTPYRVVH